MYLFRASRDRCNGEFKVGEMVIGREGCCFLKDG